MAKDYYSEKIDDFREDIKTNHYIGRFVFLQGYTNGSNKSGQNDCIFSAIKKTRMTLKIRKVSEDGKPLQGVKFKIYKSSSEKKKGDLIAEATTNSNGVINFEGLKGQWYYVQEVKSVGNYEIANPDYKVVKLTEDKQEVEFENKEKSDFDLRIVKEDDKGTTLVGAQFIIYRYVKDDGGSWYLKSEEYKKYADDKYTQSKNEAKDTETKYCRQYLSPVSGNMVSGYTKYKYSKVSYEDIKENQNYRFTTNLHGEILLKNLKVGGDYFAREMQAPNGYKQLEYPVRLGTCPTSKKKTKTIKNTPESTGACITIVKENERGTRLSGAKFVIYRDVGGVIEYLRRDHTYVKTKFTDVYDDQDYRYTTNGDGKIELIDLEPGTYYAIEVVAPSGYQKIDGEIQLGNITEKQQAPIEKKIQNIHGNVDLTIVKENETGKKLRGAVFVIYRNVGGTEEYLRRDNTYVKTNYDNVFDDEDYRYTTNGEGKIELTDLEPGTYYAIEVVAPSGYQKIDGSIELGTKTETGQKPIEKTIQNTPEVTSTEGELKVIKQDMDTGERLAGVAIRVTGSGGYYQTAITDASGEAYFSGLTPGIYLVEELSCPFYGYTVMVNQVVEIEDPTIWMPGPEGTLIPIEMPIPQVVVYLNNPKQTGNLRIRKIDPDSGRALEEVSFKVRLPNGNYLVAIDNYGNSQTRVVGSVLLSEMGETNSESDATEFVTDSSGNTEIHNILVGNYQVIETSLGDREAYELDDNYIFWTSNSGSGTGRIANVRIDRQPSYSTRDTTNTNVSEVTVKNRRKYINLSGYVWQDIPQIGKDTEGGNGLYRDNDNDSRDRLLEGILVQLKDKNGTVAQLKDKDGNIYSAEKTTDSKGAYKFERVEIDKLPEYYMEFTYNGMSYRSVIPTLDMNIKNGSRAIEGKNRTEFNSRYETITYGNSNAHKLQYDYDSENRVSTLLYGDESNYNYGYSDNPGPPVSGVDEQYIIAADTYQAYNDYIGGSNGIMTPEYARKNEVEEIENINLGMEAREHIDLSLVKDLNTVKVTINHATHVYQYGDRYKPSLWKEDPYNMSPRVKFESEYGTASYTRALYASDVYADNAQTDDTIRVKATYKIGIKNGSANLKTIINEIEDYYDSKYLDGIDNVKAGTQVNEQGDIVAGTELGIEFVNSGSNDYYKMKLKGSVEVKDQKDSFVYVQLEVKPENIIDIIGNQNKLFNIAEITSYSTKKGDDIYASIDKDSQPGNLNVNDQTTYEDDTDKAPGLQLVLQEERKMDGKVFIDTTTGELKTAEVRQGDGEYKEGEPVVKDVKVELLNLNKDRRTSR